MKIQMIKSKFVLYNNDKNVTLPNSKISNNSINIKKKLKVFPIRHLEFKKEKTT